MSGYKVTVILSEHYMISLANLINYHQSVESIIESVSLEISSKLINYAFEHAAELTDARASDIQICIDKVVDKDGDR